VSAPTTNVHALVSRRTSAITYVLKQAVLGAVSALSRGGVLSGQVLQELEDAARRMARVGAREAVVNVTLDRTLAYDIYALDKSTRTSKQVDERFVVRPEEDLSESLASFCARHGIDEQPCTDTQSQIRDLMGRDWGCDDDKLASMEAARATKIEISVVLDGLPTKLVYESSQDVVLEGARFCKDHELSMAGCARILRPLQEQAAATPAFRLSAPSAPIVARSPVWERHYPVSGRVYIDFNLTGVANQLQSVGRAHDHQLDRVCLFFDYRTTPLLCAPVPQETPLYFERHSLDVGYHVLYFAEEQPPLEDKKVDEAASPVFVAAQPFLVVSPSITIVEVLASTTNDGNRVFFTVSMQATAFDLFDPAHRVCILHNGDDLECFVPERVLVESDVVNYGDDRDPYNRVITFRAPMFHTSNGSHDMVAMLIDTESSKTFARSTPFDFELTIPSLLVPAEREASFLLEPSSFTTQRPRMCPAEWRADTSDTRSVDRHEWMCDIWRHEWGFYSQNGEDGVLAFIFHNIGAVHRSYVEFGTQDGQECNTRLLRETQNWSGLLMDGSHDNASINLHQEWITAENIMSLLSKYDVGREVDLLSIDVDFNDYWILSAMDMSAFSPRVIVVEVNSHIPPTEARAVEYRPAAEDSWDGLTDYFGASVRAFYLWGVKNGYSLVYCESHGVNCFLVRNDALGTNASAVLFPEDLFAPPNFFGRGFNYPNASLPHHRWAWVE